MIKKQLENLEFHIASDDYFGTLATRLDLLRQELERGLKLDEVHISLEKTRDELMQLQKSFRIVKKDKK